MTTQTEQNSAIMEFEALAEETATAIERFEALAESVMQARDDQAERSDEPSIAGRPIVPGTEKPIFIFDQEIERGPGFVQFGTLRKSATTAPVHEAHAMLQWGSVLLYPGNTRVNFARPFESELSTIVPGGATSEQSYPYVVFDADLAGFYVYCEGPRVLSYVATGL
jgi:hypothetical protein